MTVKNVEYKLERNTRMASYKGRYNCEILFDGSYMGDAQGDTASAARKAAERKVNAWVRDGKVVVRG